MEHYKQVEKWMRVMEVPLSDAPTLEHPTVRLYEKLIREEVEELLRAFHDDKDLVGVADGIMDLVWVSYGLAIALNLPIDDLFAEVSMSNFSKLFEDGRPRYREDGKILKPEGYQRPRLDQILKNYKRI